MKKMILLAAALLGCLLAQAQVNNRYYVGGNISLGASNYGTSVVFYPEVGKRVNDWLMVGLAAGFDWNNISSESDFTMGLIPHVRGYLPIYQRFGLTGDTYFSARWTRRRGYEPLIASQTLGFRPGIYFPIGNVTLSTQIGFFGWSRTDYGNGNASSRWQARLEARDILIGVLFNL
ncbi:MAG: hypothetical protein IJ156_02445 [Bacteroidales bacterium]|nr:hypothetical protein [Bacteroidales bacterium]